MRAGSDFTVVQASECAHLDKPAPVQQCEMGECKPQWFTTEWSAVRAGRCWSEVSRLRQEAGDPSLTPSRFCSQCSQSCGKGLQVREVRCLTEDKRHSSDCDPGTKPEQEQTCNVVPCSPQPSGRRAAPLTGQVGLPSPGLTAPSLFQMKTAGTNITTV